MLERVTEQYVSAAAPTSSVDRVAHALYVTSKLEARSVSEDRWH